MDEVKRVLVPRAPKLSHRAKVTLAIAGAAALILWGVALAQAFGQGRQAFQHKTPAIEQGTQSGQASLNRFHSAIKTLRVWMTSKNQ